MGIYGFGKAFNTRYVNSGQFCKMPHVNVRPQPRTVVFGGHPCHSNTNITINNGPQGFWGFMSGLFSTGFLGNILGMFGLGGGMNMGMPTMGMSPYSMLNAQMQPNTQPQLQAGDRLNDLKTLYPNWNIVSDGKGHYDATSKDGTVHHEGNFDEMCELLKNSQPAEKNGAPEDANPTPDPNEDVAGKGNDGAARPAGNDGAAARKGDGEGNRVAKQNNTKITNTENEEIDKTKPISVKITFSIHTTNFNDGTATVKMPNGEVFKASTGPSLTHNNAMDALADDIRQQLKNAGWTNVTLENPNFKFKQGEPKPEVDATTGAAPKAKTNWSAAEKAKPQTLKIRFAIHTLQGKKKTKSETTPEGKTHTVETSMSWTQQTAMEDLSKKMKGVLSQNGWTNVTLENTNFNWSD